MTRHGADCAGCTRYPGVRYHAPSGRHLCPMCAAGDVGRLFTLESAAKALADETRRLRDRTSGLDTSTTEDLTEALARLTEAALGARKVAEEIGRESKEHLP